jgi:LacI family transcriptional regulator
MDRYFADMDIPYVLVNNFSGVREGLKHFISKGYNRIAFVTVAIDLNQMKERENGYWETLKENKIIPEKKLILRLQYNYQKEEAVNAICSFIKKNQGVEALFFATNYLGILGLESIKKLGLRIPDDLAMMCFDDHDIFRLFPPGISVIQQPVDEIAKTAVKLLMQQLGRVKNPLKSRQIKLPPKFISRGSV